MDSVSLFFMLPNGKPKNNNDYGVVEIITNLKKYNSGTQAFLTISDIGEYNLQFNKLLIDGMVYKPDQSNVYEPLTPLTPFLKNYLNDFTNSPVNICSEDFILNSGLFFLKSWGRVGGIINNKGHLINVKYDQISLNSFIKSKYTDIIKTLSNYNEKSLGNVVTSMGVIYPLQQPESFWMIYENQQSGTPSPYKIHISIKPNFIKELLNTLFNFKQLFPIVFNNLICMNKFQMITPIHLFNQEDVWTDWAPLLTDFNGGIGYFVMYPPNKCSNNEIFIKNLIIFRDWWIINFEGVYPEAKRDAHYLQFNERISDTLFIAFGADTSNRTQALQNRNLETPRYLFKQSPNINKSIEQYCKFKSESLKKCIEDKYAIKNINCDNRDCDDDDCVWDDSKVWLLDKQRHSRSYPWVDMGISDLGLSDCLDSDSDLSESESELTIIDQLNKEADIDDDSSSDSESRVN